MSGPLGRRPNNLPPLCRYCQRVMQWFGDGFDCSCPAASARREAKAKAIMKNHRCEHGVSDRQDCISCDRELVTSWSDDQVMSQVYHGTPYCTLTDAAYAELRKRFSKRQP